MNASIPIPIPTPATRPATNLTIKLLNIRLRWIRLLNKFGSDVVTKQPSLPSIPPPAHSTPTPRLPVSSPSKFQYSLYRPPLTPTPLAPLIEPPVIGHSLPSFLEDDMSGISVHDVNFSYTGKKPWL